MAHDIKVILLQVEMGTMTNETFPEPQSDKRSQNETQLYFMYYNCI